MSTEWSVERFDFGTVEGRAVEAAFDAGLVTSDPEGLFWRDRSCDRNDRSVCGVLSRGATA